MLKKRNTHLCEGVSVFVLFLVSFEDDNEGAIFEQLHVNEAGTLIEFQIDVI